MGRRLGRKRLYALEKKGQSFSGSIGAGVSGSLVSRTVSRDGQMVITDIVIDLGSSEGAINVPGIKRLMLGYSGSTDAGATNFKAAHLGYVEHSESGIVTLVEATCLETPTGAPTRIELQFDSSAAKTYSGSAGTRVMELPTAAIGTTSQIAYDADELDGNYLYLAAGLPTSPVGTAVQTYTAGKIHIRLHGTMIPDDK